MANSPPDRCARCDNTLRGRPNYWKIRVKWQLYLQNECDLRWFLTTPNVVCCDSCYRILDHTHLSVLEYHAYGTDADADNLEARMLDELNGLNQDCIIDQSEI
mgnify:CR=1 FL=1